MAILIKYRNMFLYIHCIFIDISRLDRAEIVLRLYLIVGVAGDIKWQE